MFNKEKLFPELLMFPNAISRAKAWKRASKSLVSRTLLWTFVVGMAITFVQITFFTYSLRRLPMIVQASLIGAAIGFIGDAVGLRIGRRRIQEILRRELRAMGIPVCMVCAYDLRGSQGKVCPECGTEQRINAGVMWDETGIES